MFMQQALPCCPDARRFCLGAARPSFPGYEVAAVVVTLHGGFYPYVFFFDVGLELLKQNGLL